MGAKWPWTEGLLSDRVFQMILNHRVLQSTDLLFVPTSFCECLYRLWICKLDLAYKNDSRRFYLERHLKLNILNPF